MLAGLGLQSESARRRSEPPFEAGRHAESKQQACTQHCVGGLNCVRVPIGQIRVRQSPLFGA
jgi:hypothetical protein